MSNERVVAPPARANVVLALLLLLGGWVLVRLVPAVGNRLRTAWQRVSARGTGTGTGATGWRRWRGA